MLMSSLKRRKEEASLWGALGYCGAGILGYGVYKLARRYWRWWRSPLWKLPGPKNVSFFMGVMPKIRKEPFMAPHKQWVAEAGPEARLIHYTTLMGQHSLLVVDKDIVRTILTAPAGKANPRFEKRMAFIQNVLGSGLVVLEGPDWMRHRRILQPAFNTALLRETLTTVVPDKVNELISYWNTAAAREIDAHSHLSALTLDIIGPTAFSHEFHGLRLIREWSTDANKKEVAELEDPFMKSISNAFKFDPFSVLFFLINSATLDRIRSKKRLAREHLNDQADKIVANAATVASKNDPRKSILSTLLDAQDPEVGKLTLEEIRDEVKTCKLFHVWFALGFTVSSPLSISSAINNFSYGCAQFSFDSCIRGP